MIAKGLRPAAEKPKVVHDPTKPWYDPDVSMRPPGFPFSLTNRIQRIRTETKPVLGMGGIPFLLDPPPGEKFPRCSKCGADQMTAKMTVAGQDTYGCLCGNFINADGTPLKC